MNALQLVLTIFVLIVLGTLASLAAPLFNGWMEEKPERWKHLASRGWLFFAFDEIGGYVHDTAMSQYIPPTVFHFSTATVTYIAGQVANSIAAHRAAANQTSLITIPVQIPSNSVAQKGAYLKSIEVDFENTTAAISTSLTPTVYLIARAAEGAALTATSQASTQTPAAATTLTQTQHKLVVTLTTPIWITNLQYVLLQLSLVAGAGGSTQEFYGAVANFTMRL